jgi:hypothetical protein
MINLTLVIQILNFLITYYLFEYLFLGPMLRVLQEEDHHLSSLEERAHKARVAMREQERLNAEQWRRCQQEMAGNLPLLLTGASPALVLEKIVSISCEMEGAARERCIKEVVEILSERLSND